MEGRYYLKLQDDVLEFLSSRLWPSVLPLRGYPTLCLQTGLITYTMNIPASFFQPCALMTLDAPYFVTDDTMGPCLVTLQNHQP